MQPRSLKTLLAICVFMAFVFSTVETYTCIQCSLGECNTEKQTCETSQGCFSNKQELNTSGVREGLWEEKGCSSSKCSPLFFSATLGNGKTFGFGRQCCEAEQCNQGHLQVSQKSSDLNGVQCPACYNENDPSCTPTTLACRGTEIKCVQVIGTAQKSLILFAMGCATESACGLQGEEVVKNTNIYTYCMGPASGGPPPAPLIPSVLTGLLLLKTLL
ncbi:protein RoBo-1-like isoform X2 [Nycticebus coucang]|nr:protein RoBo-1-like isoform X2 [Nycticebus coucang]XP_053429322.1 protein RoBo-1-like isoform X2 [Nycticebus coucang]